MRRSEAQRLRQTIETAAQSLPDNEALTAVVLYPVWDAAGTYDAGVRVRHDGILYRCLQSHTAQAGWMPTTAPSLWAKVLIPDESVIPEWAQPDSTNGYSKGDRVRYEGRIYESLIDGNIWSPAAYPGGWKIVEEVT